MTTTTLNKDEDLIILSDDSLNDIIDFNFDITPDLSKGENNFILDKKVSFSTNNINDKLDILGNELDINFNLDNNDSKTTIIDDLFGDNNQTNAENIDLFGDNNQTNAENIDLFGDNKQTNVENIDLFGDNINSKTNDLEFSFEDDIKDITNNITEEKQVETKIVEDFKTVQETNNIVDIGETFVKKEVETQKSDLNRNDILDDTIGKLEIRKGIIGDAKSSKKSKVEELNQKIELLKLEVADFEKQIKDLDKEEMSIENDISLIEKMKTSSLDISIDRPRKHNLDNIKSK